MNILKYFVKNFNFLIFLKCQSWNWLDGQRLRPESKNRRRMRKVVRVECWPWPSFDGADGRDDWMRPKPQLLLLFLSILFVSLLRCDPILIDRERWPIPSGPRRGHYADTCTRRSVSCRTSKHPRYSTLTSNRRQRSSSLGPFFFH